jgi:hypothetical protein
MAAALALTGSAQAGADSGGHDQQLVQIATITGPNIPKMPGPWGFDISDVNQATQQYFLGDAGNSRVDIFDARTDQFVTDVTGPFTGFNIADLDHVGPAGVLAVGHDQVWAGKGGGTVKFIYTESASIVDSIPVGGTTRADEMALDPEDHLFVVTSPGETPPHLTFISTNSLTVVGTLSFPTATAGLEQPQWDPQLDRFLLNVPATTANPGGEVDVISPDTMAVTDVLPIPTSLNCGSSGMAVGPAGRIGIGCVTGPFLVMDVHSGNILATFPHIVGADQVAYDAHQHVFLVPASFGPPPALLGVINARTLTLTQTLPILAFSSHSIAVDNANGHVFVPDGQKGIVVYGPADDD